MWAELLYGKSCGTTSNVPNWFIQALQAVYADARHHMLFTGRIAGGRMVEVGITHGVPSVSRDMLPDG